jgi:phosphoserine phosphatase
MSVDEFSSEVSKWLASAKHPRWDRLYTALVYQPMLEVMQYLRDNGFKTYFVTGGGQDFVRVYSERVRDSARAGGRHHGWDEIWFTIRTASRS